jgi:phage portal protein BeeE
LGWRSHPPNRRRRFEVANIQLRLYQIKGDDHEEQEDHPLLTLFEGVNKQMTGIELKYVTMAHLELTGAFSRRVRRRFREREFWAVRPLFQRGRSDHCSSA